MISLNIIVTYIKNQKGVPMNNDPEEENKEVTCPFSLEPNWAHDNQVVKVKVVDGITPKCPGCGLTLTAEILKQAAEAKEALVYG